MSVIQIESVGPPLDMPGVPFLATRLIAYAEALGLLPVDFPTIRVLDGECLKIVLKEVAHQGIARDVLVQILDQWPDDPAELAGLLTGAIEALEESPIPEHEWAVVQDILGSDLLALLLDISESSVRRYAGQERDTPDDVAQRLHFLALIISDLGGAYNHFGIRRWFARKRAMLGNKAPEALLRGEWNPDMGKAQKVRELARALVNSPST